MTVHICCHGPQLGLPYHKDVFDLIPGKLASDLSRKYLYTSLMYTSSKQGYDAGRGCHDSTPSTSFRILQGPTEA